MKKIVAKMGKRVLGKDALNLLSISAADDS